MKLFGFTVKTGMGFSGWGTRKTISAEVLSKGAFSLDAGLTDKREGLLALGYERGKFGLQGGVIMDVMNRNLGRTWYAGGTVRF